MSVITLAIDNTAATDDVTDLQKQAERVLQLKMAADAAKAEFDEADKEFRAALEKAGKLTPDFQGVGHVHTAISVTKRFDEGLARVAVAKYLKKAEVKACEKVVLDPNIVKAKLTPAQLEECQKTYGHTVKYSLSKD
jgi:hypothetical protein